METPEAASSPAETVDVFQGQEVSLAEFNKYRTEGAVPERFKPSSTDQNADPEPAADQEETDKTEAEEPEPEPDSEPEESQEQVPDKTAKRIKQLLAERHELQRKLDAATKTDAKPESSTPQLSRPKPTPDEKKQDGTPKYTSYEDYVEELADWKAEQRIASNQREQAQQQALNALKTTLEAARERYDDADEVIFPAAQAIREAKIPLAVKEVFAQSENFIDLCYVVGSDPDELKKFIRLAESNPRAAIGKVFEYERGIQDELKGGSETPRDDKGKFLAPAPKKTTAPKPPSTVGGSSSKAFDVSDESLSPEEWMRKRNTDLARRS